MKRIIWLLSVIILGFSPVYSQNVNIPDSIFFYRLIDYGVDTNGDGQISYEEAAAINHLNVSSWGWWQIKSLKGIEAFVNLETLICSSNLLTSLDVSDCIALELLECHGDLLTTLDISGCTYLYELDLSNMPNLQMVCIWFVPPPIYINTAGSPNVFFTTECSTGIGKQEETGEIKIYPNPAGQLLYIEMKQPGHYTIEITSMDGRLIDMASANGKTHQVDMTRYGEGTYIITVRSEAHVWKDKVIR